MSQESLTAKPKDQPSAPEAKETPAAIAIRKMLTECMGSYNSPISGIGGAVRQFPGLMSKEAWIDAVVQVSKGLVFKEHTPDQSVAEISYTLGRSLSGAKINDNFYEPLEKLSSLLQAEKLKTALMFYEYCISKKDSISGFSYSAVYIFLNLYASNKGLPEVNALLSLGNIHKDKDKALHYLKLLWDMERGGNFGQGVAFDVIGKVQSSEGLQYGEIEITPADLQKVGIVLEGVKELKPSAAVKSGQ